MQYLLALVSLFSLALCEIPLTIDVPAHGRSCVYVRAHNPNAKIRAAFTVMSGGQFDIDATLSRPDNTVVEKVTRIESEEWLLNAPEAGEYELCFSNEMSTFSDKKVQFEFTVDQKSIEAKSPEPHKDENSLRMHEYLDTIDAVSSKMSRRLNFLKARNLRNEMTVQSTASRIWWFAVTELVAIVAMAGLNVFIVEMFFKGARKNIV